MKTFYFNFAHDVQLSVAPTFYNPSASVRKLEYALQSLAFFEASDGDNILVDKELTTDCENFYTRFSPLQVHFLSTDDIPSLPPHTLVPWGWNHSLVHTLKKYTHCPLPDNKQLHAIRQLSSRSQVAPCLHYLIEELPSLPLCGKSVFCSSLQELQLTLQRIPGKKVLKAPWSSSGRGLRFVSENCSEADVHWCQNLLTKQGGVEVEPFYEKTADWAMEFYAHADGRVTYTGLSCFSTNALSAYSGNLVAPQERLLQLWQQHISLHTLENVRDALCTYLSSWVKNVYTGPLGVDMMFCKKENEQMVLHPCVEINVRHTMGWLAGHIFNRLGREGIFKIHFENTPEKLQDFILTQSDTILPLTPVMSKTQFLAYLDLNIKY